MRPDHRPRGQRSRLRVPGAGGLHRLLLPRVLRHDAAHDRGAGRHLRLGGALRGTPLVAARASAGMNAVVRRREIALWVPGDWNAFFGLFTNVLLNVLVLTSLVLTAVKLPDQIVFGRILAALGIALPLGNLWYAYLAYQMARRTGRTDVTAMPYGPSVPHMFIVVFGVMLPIYLSTNDPV